MKIRAGVASCRIPIESRPLQPSCRRAEMRAWSTTPANYTLLTRAPPSIRPYRLSLLPLTCFVTTRTVADLYVDPIRAFLGGWSRDLAVRCFR